MSTITSAADPGAEEPPQSGAGDDQLRGRQLHASESNVERGLIGFTAAATLAVILFHAELGPAIFVWYGAVLVLCCVRIPIARRMLRQLPQPISLRQVAPFAVWSAVTALVMTSYPSLLVFTTQGFTFAFMLALCIGTFWSASSIHAPVLRISITFLLTQMAVFTASAFYAGMDWERAALAVLFICGAGAALQVIRQHSSLFAQSVQQQLELEKKTEVIGLLLREHEDQSSDWLWQTDANLDVFAPSTRFAEVIFDRPLAGQAIADILADPDMPGNAQALERLRDDLAARRSFRDVVVPCRIGSASRWFQVSGRPLFDARAGFTGYRGVMADVTAAKQAEARIVHLAHHDALTDLPNRTLLGHAVDDALRAGRAFALLSIDLDGFKPVNDCYGHPVGDRLLVEIARRLKAALESGSMVARFGGDEFVVLSWRHEPDAVEALCRRLLSAVAEPIRIGEVEAVVGASIGVAFAPADGASQESLLNGADSALYRAKQAGRGTFRFFAADMDQQLQVRQVLLQDLRLALARGEFSLHYQPFVDVRTGDVTGCEALLRWEHPERGMIPPVDFIPLAEESGLIVPIGLWVIGEACREAATWPAGQRVSVNISPVQFRDRELPDRIIEALHAAGLPANRLEIEVTETALVDDVNAAVDILRRIRAIGVHVALDDFGTGYSSLSYLRLFPFDKIKIDRSFVSDLNKRPDCQVIVRAIRDIATGLGMTITAEGVETAEQAAQLRLTGCHEFQGYFFSRPQPVRDLAAVMARRYAA
ncbi:putative bifunctional diguanylate cyclase/phosphodiesterase [Jiella sp. M17.18]|uniref:putative bifunctional diguanylate cyclase/phosphodiesterase n=1 Tax=Jiella sp. M17.18 TaxID=3234247 RepID=UPI0034DFEEC9